MAILNLAAFAEKRVSFVEQQDGPTFFSRVEDAPQVLLGLADVLAHDRRQVDAIEVEPQLVRQHLRRQCLTSAACARK